MNYGKGFSRIGTVICWIVFIVLVIQEFNRLVNDEPLTMGHSFIGMIAIIVIVKGGIWVVTKILRWIIDGFKSMERFCRLPGWTINGNRHQIDKLRGELNTNTRLNKTSIILAHVFGVIGGLFFCVFIGYNILPTVFYYSGAGRIGFVYSLMVVWLFIWFLIGYLFLHGVAKFSYKLVKKVWL